MLFQGTLHGWRGSAGLMSKVRFLRRSIISNRRHTHSSATQKRSARKRHKLNHGYFGKLTGRGNLAQDKKIRGTVPMAGVLRCLCGLRCNHAPEEARVAQKCEHPPIDLFIEIVPLYILQPLSASNCQAARECTAKVLATTNMYTQQFDSTS